MAIAEMQWRTAPASRPIKPCFQIDRETFHEPPARFQVFVKCHFKFVCSTALGFGCGLLEHAITLLRFEVWRVAQRGVAAGRIR